MRLENDILEMVREIGDYIDARIARVGFKTVSAFARVVGISRPTLDRLLNAKDPRELGSQRYTLEEAATALGFKEWDELLRAWEAGDVNRGLREGVMTVDLPREVYEFAIEQAAKEGMTVSQWIASEVVQPDERYRRRLASNGTTPHPEGGNESPTLPQ